MLRVKVLVNSRKIDEIRIHNTGMRDGSDWVYDLVLPPGHERTFSHTRELGYEPLLIQCLLELIHNPKEKPKRTSEEILDDIKLNILELRSVMAEYVLHNGLDSKTMVEELVYDLIKDPSSIVVHLKPVLD